MKLIWLTTENRTDAYKFYKDHMPHARIQKKERVCVSVDRNDIEQPVIAAARLRMLGHYQLLTGVLVHPNYRQRGLGHELMRTLRPTLERSPSFLFCQSKLTPFYQQHGFVSTSQVPAEIGQLYRRYQSQGKSLVLMACRDN